MPVYLLAKLHDPAAPVAALLGLRWQGLGRACGNALYLLATLFAGPLVYYLYDLSMDDDLAFKDPQAWLLAGARDLRLWRNLVVAPLTEEFVFRACMVPLLALEGVPSLTIVLVTPLFFGAAHLHHLLDLTRHQRVPLRRAVLQVVFQFAYTTLFGWIATFLFLRTGHLAAPVVAHVFCNWAGFPPVRSMWAHANSLRILLATAVGVTAFYGLLPRFTQPELYGNTVYVWR